MNGTLVNIFLYADTLRCYTFAMETINSLPPASIWQGKTIRLWAIEPSDWETYFELDQDEEQSRALYFIPFPPSQASVKRFTEEATVKEQEGCIRRTVFTREEFF